LLIMSYVHCPLNLRPTSFIILRCVWCTYILKILALNLTWVKCFQIIRYYTCQYSKTPHIRTYNLRFKPVNQTFLCKPPLNKKLFRLEFQSRFLFYQIESKLKNCESKKISYSQSNENDPEPWKRHSDK
jgi:hypothetical protein